jgi:hypothetical protein
MAGIQLSERRVDPVIREEGWSSYQRGGWMQIYERRVGVQI